MSFMKGIGLPDVGNMVAHGPMVGSFSQLGKQMGKLDSEDMRNISKISGLIGATALGATALGGGTAAGSAGGAEAGTAGANAGGVGYGTAPQIGAYPAATSAPLATPAMLPPAVSGAMKIYGIASALNKFFGQPEPFKRNNMPQSAVQSSKQDNKPRGR